LSLGQPPAFRSASAFLPRCWVTSSIGPAMP
jgi:hypothetical protein